MISQEQQHHQTTTDHLVVHSVDSHLTMKFKQSLLLLDDENLPLSSPHFTSSGNRDNANIINLEKESHQKTTAGVCQHPSRSMIIPQPQQQQPPNSPTQYDYELERITSLEKTPQPPPQQQYRKMQFYDDNHLASSTTPTLFLSPRATSATSASSNSIPQFQQRQHHRPLDPVAKILDSQSTCYY